MGSQQASKKAGFSRRQCCGYIYTHAAAQLLSGSHLQTAGEQDAFQRGRFSHGIYFRFLWDDLSIHVFSEEGGRKINGEANKQSRWTPFPAAHAALSYFLPCHPSWLHLWPGLGHRHSTVLPKATGKRLSFHSRSFFMVSSVAKQIKSRIIMPTPKIPIPHIPCFKNVSESTTF